MDIKEVVLVVSPLLVIQVGLALYCGNKIFKEGVENLNKWLWLLICLFVNVLGPIIFLLVGRRKEFR